MFEDSPFRGACAYATYEVVVMLLGSLLLGLLLGFLIWGWLRKHVSVLKRRAAVLQHMVDLRQLNAVSMHTKLISLKEQVELLGAKLSLAEYRMRKAQDETEAMRNQMPADQIAPQTVSDVSVGQKDLFAHTPAEVEEPTTLADISRAMEKGSIDPSTQLHQPFSPAHKYVPLQSQREGADSSGDDLKVIVGIDQKMEDILQRLGIRSWSNLAYIRPEDLQRIIEDAGEAYASQNPRAWIIQARMASKGEWKKLKAYQETLT